MSNNQSRAGCLPDHLDPPSVVTWIVGAVTWTLGAVTWTIGAVTWTIGAIESGMSLVVFGTVAFSLLISVALLLTRSTGSAYDQIGRGGLSHERGVEAASETGALDSAAGRAEQEREIRQMLRARSERLVRRGQPALDIDAELARLLAPAAQPDAQRAALVEEVRQLVVARNERRMRRGLEPLDVEAETARTLREMEP
jgi:hypothetical protein